jgi:hypothetical protein
LPPDLPSITIIYDKCIYEKWTRTNIQLWDKYTNKDTDKLEDDNDKLPKSEVVSLVNLDRNGNYLIRISFKSKKIFNTKEEADNNLKEFKTMVYYKNKLIVRLDNPSRN